MFKKFLLLALLFSSQLLPMAPKMPHWPRIFLHSGNDINHHALAYTKDIFNNGSTVKETFSRDLVQWKKNIFLHCVTPMMGQLKAEEFFEGRQQRALGILAKHKQCIHDEQVPVVIRSAIVEEAQKRGIENLSIEKASSWSGNPLKIRVGLYWSTDCVQEIKGVIDHELAHILENDDFCFGLAQLAVCKDHIGFQHTLKRMHTGVDIPELINDVARNYYVLYNGTFPHQEGAILSELCYSMEFVADQLYALEHRDYAMSAEEYIKKVNGSRIECFTHPADAKRLRALQAIIACLKEEKKLKNNKKYSFFGSLFS